jgi:hypothetical protein
MSIVEEYKIRLPSFLKISVVLILPRTLFKRDSFVRVTMILFLQKQPVKTIRDGLSARILTLMWMFHSKIFFDYKPLKLAVSKFRQQEVAPLKQTKAQEYKIYIQFQNSDLRI